MVRSESKRRRWLISIQMLADELEDRMLDFDVYAEGDEPRLLACALYCGQKELQEDILYILPEDGAETFPVDRFCWVASGNISGKAPHICSLNLSMSELMNLFLSLFRKFKGLELELSDIVTEGGSISDLLLAADSVFHNPMYVHDNMFSVIALPRKVEGMLGFEYNQKTGKIYIPLWLIEEFKFDESYRHTLTLHEPGIWGNEEYPRHFRSLYVNLWDGSHYCGRLLINELQTALKPSHAQTAVYLAEFILMILRRDARESRHSYRDFEETFVDLANRQEVSPSDLGMVLDILGWRENDDYLCIRVRNQDSSLNIKTITVLRSAMSVQLTGHTSFFFENDLCLLVNLRVSDSSFSEMRGIMASHVRESYLFCGISNPFRGIRNLAEGMAQTEIALKFISTSGNTSWIMDFSDCVIPYIQHEIKRFMKPELVAAPDLLRLREFDRENGTEYYRTLRAYLLHERSIPETSEALIIHRTTLSYRLKKLKGLMTVNLDNEDVRLYLLFSFRLLES